MIRRYTRDDLDSLWELYLNCFPEPCPFDQFSEALNSGTTLVADSICGLYGGLISFIDQGDPWIWNIFVRPFARRNGTGTQLLKEIEKYYRDSTLHLYVEKGNSAIRLYSDLGYQGVEEVSGIYRENLAIEMVKNI
jgi:ribosomal protein S18 acetylase RimI-like enzyme